MRYRGLYGVMLMSALVGMAGSVSAQDRPLRRDFRVAGASLPIVGPVSPPPVPVAAARPDTSRAEPRQWAAKGALIGAVIGVAAGAYEMSRTGCGADASDRGCEVAVIAYITFLGTLTGALVGAVADVIIPRASHPSDGATRLETFARRRLVR